jgi:hypothetical protein
VKYVIIGREAGHSNNINFRAVHVYVCHVTSAGSLYDVADTRVCTVSNRIHSTFYMNFEHI